MLLGCFFALSVQAMVELMWAVKAHRHAETYQRVIAYLCSYFGLLLFYSVVSQTLGQLFAARQLRIHAVYHFSMPEVDFEVV